MSEKRRILLEKCKEDHGLSNGVYILQMKLNSHTDTINEIVYFPRLDRIISVCDDFSIKFWDLKEEKCIKTILRENYVNDVVVLDESRFLTCGYDGFFSVYSAETFELLKEFKNETAVDGIPEYYNILNLKLLKVSEDKFICLQSSQDSEVLMYSLSTGKMVKSIRIGIKSDNYSRMKKSNCHENSFFINCGNHGVKGKKDNVLLMNYETCKIIRSYETPESSWLYMMELIQNGKQEIIAVAAESGKHVLFDSISGEIIKIFEFITLSRQVKSSFSLNGVLFMGDASGMLNIVDMNNNFRIEEEKDVDIFLFPTDVRIMRKFKVRGHSVTFLVSNSKGDIKVVEFVSKKFNFDENELEMEDLRERCEYLKVISSFGNVGTFQVKIVDLEIDLMKSFLFL